MGKVLRDCIFPLSIIIILASVVCPVGAEGNEIVYQGKGWRTEYNGLPVYYFSGSPREIGKQHGKLVLEYGGGELITAYEEMKEKMSEDKTDKINSWFKDFYLNYKFIPAFKRHIHEEYLQELEGMMAAVEEGQGQNIDEFIVSNASQDLGLVFGCSVFAGWDEMTENGEMLVGRNLDYLELRKMAKYRYLAFYNPEKGNKFVTLNYPTYTGVMQGMNENGLVLAMTYSPVIEEERNIDGLPYTIMLRRTLQYAENLQEAINMIKNTPRTVGLNILIASSEDNQAAVVEMGANRIYVREEDDFIFATNRYQSEYMKQYQGSGWLASSLRDKRFNQLEERYKGKLDLKKAVSMVRDKYDPESIEGRGYVKGINGIATIASLVFRPDELEVWASNRGNYLSPEGDFIGLDAEKIWETGKPVSPVGVIASPEETKYNQNWRLVREAELAFKEGKNERIVELLSAFIAENPEAEYPLLLLGIANIRLEKYQKGISYLKDLIELPRIAEPYNLLQGYFWLGITHDIFLDERKTAIDYYNKGLEVEIDDVIGESNYYQKICQKGVKSPIILENGQLKANN